MKKSKFLPLLSVLLLLQACVTQISQEKIASADYGPPPPENYQELIKERISRTLIDPTSPIFDFDIPRKGYTKKSPLFNTQERFGWMVCGTVNSKNRFGGYVGRVPYFVLFRDGTIVEMVFGETADSRHQLANTNILQACNR